MTNPWPDCPRLPRGPSAALAALHIGDPVTAQLASLDRRAWDQTLEFCSRSQISLALHLRARQAMPPEIREIADASLLRNTERLRNIEDLYRFVAERLQAAEVPFIALKGLTQCPQFGAAPEHRPQYDIDLYAPREYLTAGHNALTAAGFEPLPGMESFPTDHVPPLIRKTGWRWRGDIFDPEMPLPVELHFRFWNAAMEHLPAPRIEEFWERRQVRTIAGIPLGTLSEPDALGYAALHLLKHILHGSIRPFHVYELACFLDGHAACESFWAGWRGLHAPELRRLEAVAFGIAARWFGCRLGPAQEEIDSLPAATQTWLRHFALSPAFSPFDSNKDELWLHFSLLSSRRDRISVARRRLLPERLPGPVDDTVYAPAARVDWRRRVLRSSRYSAYILRRTRHHLVSYWRLALSALRWWNLS